MNKPNATPAEAVEHLLASGWTYQALADEVGVVKSTVHRIKTGGATDYRTGTALMRIATDRRRKPPRKRYARRNP